MFVQLLLWSSVCRNVSWLFVFGLTYDLSFIMSVFILSLIHALHLFIRCCFSFLSSAGGGDHGMFGLCEERISCLRFLLSLSPLHTTHTLSGRARPLGLCWTGTPVNHSLTCWSPTTVCDSLILILFIDYYCTFSYFELAFYVHFSFFIYFVMCFSQFFSLIYLFLVILVSCLFLFLLVTKATFLI